MTDPIQQQLIDARRNQILDAATQVFAHKGFHATKIKDIAAEAGIADGTIYNYFKNKQTLLLGIFDRMRDSVQAGDVLPQPGDVTLREFIRAFLAQPLTILSQDDFALFRVVMSEMLVSEELRTLYYEQILAPTIALGETYLAQWAERGEIPAANVGMIARTVSSMVMGLMLEHIMGDPQIQQQWDELPDFLTDFVLQGIQSNDLFNEGENQ